MPTIGASSSSSVLQLTWNASKTRKAHTKKPHHLEPVSSFSSSSSLVSASAHGGRLRFGPMVNYGNLTDMDTEERTAFSSTHLRSMVSSTLTREKGDRKSAVHKSTNQPQRDVEERKQLPHEWGSQRNLTDASLRRRPTSNNSDMVEPDLVLSRLDAAAQTLANSTASRTQPNSSSVRNLETGGRLAHEEQASTCECDGEFAKSQRSAHIRTLLGLRDRVAIPASSRKADNPFSMDAMMQVDGTKGTTLARYRRLVGTVARKHLHHIYNSATQRVAVHRKQQECATRIQCAFNAFLQRTREHRERKAEASAVVLQCCWRSRCARRTMVFRRNQRDRQKLITRQNAVELGEKRSVTRIQRQYRCYLAWKVRARRREHACRQLVCLWRLQRLRKTTEASRHIAVSDNSPPLPASVEGLFEQEGRASELVGGSRVLESTFFSGDARESFRHASPNELRGSDLVVAHLDGSVSCEMERESEVSFLSAVCNHPPPSFLLERQDHPVVLRDVDDREEDTSVGSAILSVDHAPNLESDSNFPPMGGSVALGEHAELTSLLDLIGGNSSTHGGKDLARVRITEATTSSTTDMMMDVEADARLDQQIEPQPHFDRKSEAVAQAETIVARSMISWKERRDAVAHQVYTTKHRAAVKIQSLLRQRLAVQHIRLVRHLALLSLRCELKHFWLDDESFDTNRSDQAGDHDGARGPTSDPSDGDSSDEDWIEQSDNDQGKASSSSGLGFLPMKNGAIPPGVQVDLTSTGFWKWNWATEVWTM